MPSIISLFKVEAPQVSVKHIDGLKFAKKFNSDLILKSPFSGLRDIMEYEIISVEAYKESKPVTQTFNSSFNLKKKEISRMVVEISFRRRIEFHVANTLLQVHKKLNDSNLV